ncbi:extracellular solute-binding protein [Actinopolymorpha sp. B17G11]|uniref:ABC transporter substrate-binding protein n=1 Tax=Actinopolymorpha sp. B17G11 TaxID=3160861 RepID=UPI0032E3AF22
MPTTARPATTIGSRHLTRRGLLGGAFGLAAVGTSLPALASCGGGGGSTAEVTAWQATSWESAAEMKKWLKYIGAYFKDHEPQVKWNVDYGTSFDQYFQKLQTSIAGGGDVDMCWMHGRFVPQFAGGGMLEPLDDLIKNSPPPEWPDDYYPSQVKGFQSDGVQYGMPYDLASGGFYVNVDWFERAGVDLPTEDWTFEDLLEAAKTLKAAAKDPEKSWAMTLPTATVPMYWLVRSFGGDFFADDTRSRLTEPGTVEAFQYVHDAMWNDKVMPTPADLATADAAGAGDLALFGSERLAIIFNLNDTAFAIEDFVQGKFSWTAAPTPRGKDRRFQQVGGSSFSIPKSSRSPELSFEIMKYLMSAPDVLPDVGKLGSLTPARISFAKYGQPAADVLPADDFAHTFSDLVERDGAEQSFFAKYAEWESSIFTVKIDALWTNSEPDAATILADMDAETQALLGT